MAYAKRETQQKALAAYYANHRDCLKERMRQRYRTNRETRLAKQREYHRTHRAHALERIRAYRLANREQVRAQRRAYYAAHRAILREKVKQYRALHPEIDLIKKSRRRARQSLAPQNDFTPAQWRELKALWKYRCAYCGEKPTRLSQDHITPLAQGGTHTASNIVPACISCNSRKHISGPLVPVQPVLLTLASSKPFASKRS